MLAGEIDLGQPAMKTPDERAQARAVMVLHLANLGICAWCWSEAGYATPHPCTIRQWADAVLADEAASPVGATP